MTSTSESTSLSAMGQWLSDFYKRVFFQPDDDVSAKALNDGVAEGFTARINHEHLSQQALSEAIRKFRLDNSSTVQSTRDIQTWDAPNDSGAGCVSQFLHFTDTNKETGVATKMTTLLIANIQVIDGQKKLSELTEVMKASS